MPKLIWIGLLIAVVATLSGQSGKGTQTPARSATLPSDVQPDSLNRRPVVKREQVDENGKKVYDLNAGGPGKIAQPTGPGAITLYSPGASEPLRKLNNYLRREGNILGNGITENDLLVHDEQHPRAAYAFLLAHMEHREGFPTPIGVLRAWNNVPRYEDLIAQQIKDVQAKKGKGDLAKLLRAGDTWELKA